MDFLAHPVSWWYDPFASFPFMRDALLAAILAVLATSIVGTWVVLRGMSFLGDALAHGVLPGVAIAFVLGGSTTLGAFAAALAMVGGVAALRSRTPFDEDTSIGILFVGFLALAVVIMSGSGGSYSGDLNRFLFGSITGVDDADLIRQAVAAAVSIGGVVLFYRAFLLMTFDEVQAQLAGLRPRLAHLVLVVLVAVSIVASFETVGNLLVFAFLVAPPATASLLVRRVPLIMLTAVACGWLASLVGLLISYHHDTAAGASMALVAVVLFLLTVSVRSAGEALRSRRPGRYRLPPVAS
jgi:ABC-type Mn2+/Zn2+ transport system permease subunit